MSSIKKLLLILVFLITIGLLGYSSWHQWSNNQHTVLERMKPIPTVAEYMHSGRIVNLKFPPADQDLIATAGNDNTIRIWSRNKPDNPTEIQFGQEGRLFSLEYLKNGDFLLCRGLHGEIGLWNVLLNEMIYLPQEKFQWDIAISPSADKMAAVHSERLVLWNIENLNEPSIITEITEVHHTKYINTFRCAAFSPNEKTLAIGYANGDIRIWDLAQEQFIKTLSVPTDSHASLRRIKFIPDGRWIVALQNPSLTIWDTDKNLQHVLLESYQGFLRELKFAENGRFIGITTRDGMGSYIIWSLPEVLMYHQMSYQQASEGIISGIAFSPDGKILAVSNPGEVTLISLETLSPLAILKNKGFFGGAQEVTFSPDGTMLAGGAYGGIVRLWDVRNYNEE